MLRTNRLVLVLIMAVMYALPAFGVSFETFELRESNPEDQQVFKIYLNGVGNGFMFANARLELKGKPTLYCQPGGLTLNSGNYISLIEGVASRDDLPPSLDIEVMLLIGLEREFPCP